MNSTMTDFQRDPNHHRHSPGVPQAQEYWDCCERLDSELTRIFNPLPYRIASDLAWLIMLHRGGVITLEQAGRLLSGLRKIASEGRYGYGGEETAIEAVGGDEDLGSLVGYGRTLQEPMSRLQLREKLLDVFDVLIKLRRTVLSIAEAHVDTVMAGYTHLSHAQPTTYAAYLISVYDHLERGQEQLEMSYRYTNRNTGGCGALAGPGFTVDRQLFGQLLGLHDLVEPAYDCEAAQDHSTMILFALTNLGLVSGRVAMDMNLKTLEEVGDMKADPAWAGVSAFMPQKCISGSQLERIRIEGNRIIGFTNEAIAHAKGEPHGDMLPICEVWQVALRGMCHAEKMFGLLEASLRYIRPNPTRMLEHARAGYAATPDLVAHLVQNGIYGPRRAHRVCGTFVRLAREQEIPAYEATGELLDSAAEGLGETPPRLDTSTVRELLDPVSAVARHDGPGEPAAMSSRHMIKTRSQRTDQAEADQSERRQHVRAAQQQLDDAVDLILKDHSDAQN